MFLWSLNAIASHISSCLYKGGTPFCCHCCTNQEYFSNHHYFLQSLDCLCFLVFDFKLFYDFLKFASFERPTCLMTSSVRQFCLE